MFWKALGFPGVLSNIAAIVATVPRPRNNPPNLFLPSWTDLLALTDNYGYSAPFKILLWWISPSWSANFRAPYVSIVALRYVESLLIWSYWLDVCAVCSAAVLALCIWRESRVLRLSRRHGSVWTVIPAPFGYSQSAGIVLVVTLIFLPRVANAFEALVFAGLGLRFLYSQIDGLVHRLDRDRRGLWRNLPRSVQCQVALSLFRLRALDPYSHQIQFVDGIVQLFLLFYMLNLARASTNYWHQCMAHYVDEVIHARYPELYRTSTDARKAARKMYHWELARERKRPRPRRCTFCGSCFVTLTCCIVWVALAVFFIFQWSALQGTVYQGTVLQGTILQWVLQRLGL